MVRVNSTFQPLSTRVSPMAAAKWLLPAPGLLYGSGGALPASQARQHRLILIVALHRAARRPGGSLLDADPGSLFDAD